MTGLFCAQMSRLRQRVADGAERIADLGSEQAHDCNHNDGYESKDDCVFDKALTFFFWCE